MASIRGFKNADNVGVIAAARLCQRRRPLKVGIQRGAFAEQVFDHLGLTCPSRPSDRRTAVLLVRNVQTCAAAGGGKAGRGTRDGTEAVPYKLSVCWVEKRRGLSVQGVVSGV